jgi:hypothetical protein
MSERRRSTASKRGKGRKAFKVLRSNRVQKSRTDFSRLDAMGDEDIAAQIAQDPDVAREFTEKMARDARWIVLAAAAHDLFVQPARSRWTPAA